MAKADDVKALAAKGMGAAEIAKSLGIGRALGVPGTGNRLNVSLHRR